MKKYNNLKITLLIILAICLFMPIRGYAASGEFSEDDKYKYVQFGKKIPRSAGNLWVILDPLKTNAGDDGGALLLLDDYENLNINFNDYNIPNEKMWEGSTSQAWCADYYNSEAFTDEDRSAILGVKTNEGNEVYSDTNYNKMNSDYVMASDIDGTRTGDDAALDKIFFLSAKEYWTYAKLGTPYHYDTEDYLFSTPYSFWLRSPIQRYSWLVTGVSGSEDYGSEGWIVYTRAGSSSGSVGVLARPALNLDRSKVTIVSGTGTKTDPYILDAIREKVNQDPPTANTVNASGKNESDGKITDVDDTMEYSNDGTNWTKVSTGATEVVGLPPGTYYVRYAETDEFNASEPFSVNVGYNSNNNGVPEQTIINPKTGDNILEYVVILLFSLFAMILLFVYSRKTLFSKNNQNS